jgi:hypothetical protein
MSIEHGEEEAIEVEPCLLLSTLAAAKLAGVSTQTWVGIAEANGISGVPTGHRTLWRRHEVERLLGIREPA